MQSPQEPSDARCSHDPKNRCGDLLQESRAPRANQQTASPRQDPSCRRNQPAQFTADPIFPGELRRSRRSMETLPAVDSK